LRPISSALDTTARGVPLPDRPPRHLPGEAGIWLFICGDLLVFSLFFVTFLYYRGQELALFRAARLHLDQGLGALNTLFMLSSSWFVASGVRAVRGGAARMAPYCFALAWACGCGFGVVKFFEYRAKIRAGITLNTNDFYMYYYMFTGIHFMHVLIGMGVLAFLTRYTWRGACDARKIRNIESGASFWHVVDLLWIVLFALLYLIP